MKAAVALDVICVCVSVGVGLSGWVCTYMPVYNSPHPDHKYPLNKSNFIIY